MQNNKLKVLTVCGTLIRRKGGAPTSVPSLCRELSKNGCDITILTSNYDENDIEDCGKSKVLVNKSTKDIKKLIWTSDIVHFNEIWHISFIKIMMLCQKYEKPYIVTPRASLMLADVNRTYFKIFKKYIAWHLYMKRNLKNASGFHVTAKNELDDLSQFGFDTQVAVCPNGINLKEYIKKIDRRVVNKLFPRAENKKILLFFSRIAPKKGLLLLAHAWERIAKDNTDWYLLIVGPDDENYWPQVKSILDQSEPGSYARSDYLKGDARMAVLQHADIFVLPTYWENFGIVVAESLMAETPVITTTKTPWTELEAIGSGWTIEPSKAALEHILRKAMALDKQTLQHMGQKGREYVSEYFDWRNIAIDMKKYYTYILGKSRKPEFVHQLQGSGDPILPIRKPGIN
jgi:glycosyltransferase involved in cell wall biosynthesis